MPFPQFDRSRLQLKPLDERQHDVQLSVLMDPDATPDVSFPAIDTLAERIRAARENGSAVLMMLGAHVIRAGAAPCLIRLMEDGYITHFALNGAGGIHDFELALIGSTCESVARYIREGQFGLWQEDGLYNRAVNEGAADGILAASNDGQDFAAGNQFAGIIAIGFDAGKTQKAAVQNGWFYGSITQDPYTIGYKSVQLALDAINGKPSPGANVDTGAKWYDKTNITDPVIAPLLYD